MARNRLRLNFLGVLSLLTGVAAFVATKYPIAGYGPIAIAGIGISLGVLGFLLAIMTGNWGSGLPVLGILVSLSALALVGYNNGTLENLWAKVHPKSTPPPAAIPAITSQQPGTTGGSDDHRPRSIFDEPGANTYNRDSGHAPTPGPTANVAPASPTVMTQHPAPVVPRPAGPTVQQARAKLDAATAAVERSLAGDPTYVQAQKDVADADATRKAALAADGAGSASVQDASTQWLEAKSKLRKLVDAAAAKDPATVAAQHDLKDAELNARGAK